MLRRRKRWFRPLRRLAHPATSPLALRRPGAAPGTHLARRPARVDHAAAWRRFRDAQFCVRCRGQCLDRIDRGRLLCLHRNQHRHVHNFGRDPAQPSRHGLGSLLRQRAATGVQRRHRLRLLHRQPPVDPSHSGYPVLHRHHELFKLDARQLQLDDRRSGGDDDPDRRRLRKQRFAKHRLQSWHPVVDAQLEPVGAGRYARLVSVYDRGHRRQQRFGIAQLPELRRGTCNWRSTTRLAGCSTRRKEPATASPFRSADWRPARISSASSAKMVRSIPITV